ncbi:MAG TPA: hypothetical protein VIT68_02410, partial [Candidatus Gracilibacteria bacterium]
SDQSEERLLRAQIDRAQNISESERAWYYGVLDKPEHVLDWEEKKDKIEFYLRAANQRTRIWEMAPTEHKDKVYAQVTEMLSSSIARDDKPQRLKEMHQALNAFWGMQRIIQDGVRRIEFFPDGFEARIWDRFQTMYLAQGGNLLDPQSITRFEDSIKTTFQHLARIAEKQEELRVRFQREKLFMTKDAKTGQSMREVLLRQFESQMYHWLDNSLSLREWSKAFSDLVEKQMPEKLKAFNNDYHQVYTTDFWGFQRSFSPQEFPNFAATFNFSKEEDFLHRFTPQGIKKKTKMVHEALVKDSREFLTTFFTDTERKRWKQRIRGFKPPQIVGLMKTITELKKERESSEAEAERESRVIQAFDRRRYVLEGVKAVETMRKDFGKGVFLALGMGSFVADLESRGDRIEELKRQLGKAHNFETQYEIQQQLIDLDATFYFPDHTPAAREHKIAQLKEQFSLYLSASSFSACRNIASKLKKYDAVAAYELFKTLEQEESKNEKTDGNQDQTLKPETPKVETSHDKLTKIRFFERCIEHAEKVEEACNEIGIPTDDPDYWGEEGLKERVNWLKDNGLYHVYQKYNASDPNIPKDAQAGGFRFRWLDGRGADVSSAKAEQGMKYLDRYKESGYMLCALAGAFSIDWNGSGDTTYCPSDFIDAMREEIASV